MKLIPIPAFSDNYIWCLADESRALVVDPGDAAPVLALLQAQGLQLDAILVTHHHADHTGGVATLQAATGARVFAPAGETLPAGAQAVAAGTAVSALDITWQVLDIPGHTAGHVAYCSPALALSDGAAAAPVLFCGDTLFCGGCGRVFEGTAAQMAASLQQLAALPGSTRVCCAHEYTLSNLRFASAVEPANPELAAFVLHCQALRAQGRPTLPSTVAQELRINPFLRTDAAAVVASAHRFDASVPADGSNPVLTFAALRAWKNDFK